mgnify:CR=1 FL=1
MKTQSNRLTFSQQFFIATMLFGLFFGAGNLIFPIFLGSQAGRNVWPAIVGNQVREIAECRIRGAV